MEKKVVNSILLTPGTGVAWGEVTRRAKEITLTQRGAHMHEEQDFFGPSSTLCHFQSLFLSTRGCVRREVSKYFNLHSF